MEAFAFVADSRALGIAGNSGRSFDWPNPTDNHPLLLGSFILVGTFWILPVVYFLRFMPLVVRAVQASMEQIDAALEEAAAVWARAGGKDLRASRFRSFGPALSREPCWLL